MRCIESKFHWFRKLNLHYTFTAKDITANPTATTTATATITTGYNIVLLKQLLF